MGKGRLVFIGLGQNREKLFEWSKITPLRGGSNDGLDPGDCAEYTSG